MIKKIKVKKQLRLDELIKYVWDNDIKAEMEFRSNEERVLIEFDDDGRVLTDWIVSKEDTFTVEVEEPITEDTRIQKTATLTKNEEVFRSWNNSINGLKKTYPDALQIHAIVNGKLQLMWEAESDEL